jgi:hypothetical protein
VIQSAALLSAGALCRGALVAGALLPALVSTFESGILASWRDLLSFISVTVPSHVVATVSISSDLASCSC